MSTKVSILNYLSQARYAQLATTKGYRPWICTVYITSDTDQNIYWLSYPERRHSQEIAANPNVSMAVAVKLNQPVIGLQIEGTAAVVEDSGTVEAVMKQYVVMHKDTGKDFYQNFLAGKNRHQLYKLTPTQINLFDEVNFPGGKAVIWRAS